ncbi:MAG: hypothetical protein ACRBN8_29780 [Nannocystales bacterium]
MTTLGPLRRPAILFTALLGLGACGDDASSGAETEGASTGGPSETVGEESGSAAPSTTGSGSSSEGSTSDDGTTSTGALDDSSSGSEGSSSTGTEPAQEWGALVRGSLFTDDLVMAQATHDAVAMGGQEAAMLAGDFGHDALLGTTILGGIENEFLGIDQWTNLDGALAVYGDPKFQAGFGMLFAEPPALELFAKRDDWHGWGSLEAGDGDRHWYVVVRGRLADEDLDAAQAAHDAVAMAGEKGATALGDVAHVVWVGTPDDPQEFFAVDVWTDDSMIEAFYGNPKFGEAFGALFEAPPVVAVYGSTDWHQW